LSLPFSEYCGTLPQRGSQATIAIIHGATKSLGTTLTYTFSVRVGRSLSVQTYKMIFECGVCVCVPACVLYTYNVYKDKNVIARGLMFIRAQAYKHKQNTNTNVVKRMTASVV
jgi:hypothetical protein